MRSLCQESTEVDRKEIDGAGRCQGRGDSGHGDMPCQNGGEPGRKTEDEEPDKCNEGKKSMVPERIL